MQASGGAPLADDRVNEAYTTTRLQWPTGSGFRLFAGWTAADGCAEQREDGDPAVERP